MKYSLHLSLAILLHVSSFSWAAEAPPRPDPQDLNYLITFHNVIYSHEDPQLKDFQTIWRVSHCCIKAATYHQLYELVWGDKQNLWRFPFNLLIDLSLWSLDYLISSYPVPTEDDVTMSLQDAVNGMIDINCSLGFLFPPLHIALAKSDSPLNHRLLQIVHERLPDYGHRDVFGRTALDWARLKNCPQMIAFLTPLTP